MHSLLINLCKSDSFDVLHKQNVPKMILFDKVPMTSCIFNLYGFPLVCFPILPLHNYIYSTFTVLVDKSYPPEYLNDLPVLAQYSTVM